jgi:hypothetical protein
MLSTTGAQNAQIRPINGQYHPSEAQEGKERATIIKHLRLVHNLKELRETDCDRSPAVCSPKFQPKISLPVTTLQ